MNTILFGFKGCGKTHFGKLLSRALKRPFLDTDALIVEGYRRQYGGTYSIRTIYRHLQEKAFREWEKKIIHQLPLDGDYVISLGGGSVLDVSNVTHLQKIGQLIYLKIDFETVYKRILDQGIPSFVDPKYPLKSLNQIYQDRIPIYEAIPAEGIDVGFLDEATILDHLCQFINAKELSYGL